MSSAPSVTLLLERWKAGDPEALGALVEQVYPELRRIAAAHLRREARSPTLQPTALVHDAYLRLVGQAAVDWEGRRHFLAVASRTMRRLLIEHARQRRARKRRGIQVSLHDDAIAGGGIDTDALALVEALDRMEQAGYRFETDVVQLRYFGGLTMEETAQELGVGHATVGRAWAFARSWLLRELRRDAGR